MKKEKNNLKFNFKIYLLPIFLLFIWLFFTLFYIFNNNFSLSVISYPGSKDNIVNYNTKKITTGKKIIGQLTAKENYLGVVSINFKTFKEVAYSDEDVLLFSIKERGASDWYYQNTYRSGGIYKTPLYPFGFPKIYNSKGKVYVFEIKSLYGNSKNSVALSSWEPVLLSRYQIPKEEIIADSKLGLFSFFAKRAFIGLGRQDVQFFSLIYFLPLFFYLLLFFPPFIAPLKPIVKKTRTRIRILMLRYWLFRPFYYFIHFIAILFLTYLDVIIFLLILFNIFFITILNDIALLVVAILWFYLANYYNDTSRKTFVAGIALLTLCPFILQSEYDNIAEKSAVWAYVFFATGAVQLIFEQRKKASTAIEGNYKNRFYLKEIVSFTSRIAKEGKAFLIFLGTYIFNYIFIKNRRKVFNFLIIILVIVSLFLLGRIISNKYFGDPCIKPEITLKTTGKEGPLIKSIEPTYVHYGDKVVIRGDNFDWNLNKPLKIFTNYGEIKADYWDSTTIIFSIPLDFKEKKEIAFWLSTPSGSIEDNPISNTARITLLNRLGEFNKDDIRYLRQSRCLTPKAKEVNNFSNFKLGKYSYLVEFFLKFF